MYAARPRAAQNRWLALLMIADGIFVGAGWGMVHLATSAGTAFAFVMVSIVGWLFFPVLYLFFMSTLKAPLARPLASRPGQRVLIAFLLVAAGTSLLGRHSLVGGVTHNPQPFGWIWDWDFQPLFFVVLSFVGLVMLGGLAVAVSLFRATPLDSPRRPAAVAYLAAFLFRDGMVLFSIACLAMAQRVPSSTLYFLTDATIPVATIGFTLLLGYGILRTQLFDIDLRIKWGLRRGTLVTLYLAVFFMVTVSAENFLTDRYGWAYGGLAAGFLLFALTPLQRLADGVANAAMPSVHDNEEYRTVRKREVYQAALEGAMEDGEVSPRERAVLARLADSLGLSATEALGLERVVEREGPHLERPAPH